MPCCATSDVAFLIVDRAQRLLVCDRENDRVRFPIAGLWLADWKFCVDPWICANARTGSFWSRIRFERTAER